ncbi:MAG: Unknown protein [uncultured Sulfurovum sp.]|uniref:Glycosyl transferase family 1 domain-containing protein n=1 Tax=uncultured Sulfurovum sp. TaxID=269237 RepID=A0A6S6T813_9BACT|nr:MAG: Unknown protein [uncultured Sulfurovum sp.]
MNKLLIISRWYLPAVKSGGTVRSVVALVNGLKEDFSISILTSDRDLGAKEAYENVELDRVIKHNGTDIIYLSKLNMESIGSYIKLQNPDIIYLNSFFDVTTVSVMLLKLRGKIKTQIILAPRGELAEGALSIKANKKKVYLFFYKLLKLSKGIIFHATSNEDKVDIKRLFPSNEIELIQNPKERNTKQYTLPFKEKNSLKMVFISRIAPVKNLLYGLEILNNNKFEGKIEFDIYGPDEDKKYWHECQEIIKQLPENIEVNYKGFVEPKDIGSTLSKYHLFFLPTKGENFGHAIVEAMEVGLLPLISDKTPWTKLEDKKAGYSLSLEDNTAYARAIKEVLIFSNDLFLDYSNNIKKYVGEKINSKKTLEDYKVLFKT